MIPHSTESIRLMSGVGTRTIDNQLQFVYGVKV